jgi:hypothetical protein
MTRQEQIEQLDYEFSLEAWAAEVGHYEPDYKYLAERFNKVCALVDRSDDIVVGPLQ